MARRILDETTKSTFASDDYLYMDGQTDGASKITPDNLVRNTTVAQQLAQHIADAEDEVEQITGDIEEIQSDITDVKSDIGDLEDLETEDKSSLVNAINEARGTGGSGSGLTEDVKVAMLQIAEHVAYTDAYGQEYYNELYNALYPPADLVSISAVYTQSGTVYDTDSLNDLKSDLVVTATYDDSSTATITGYTLSGTLTEGTSTITVTYGGKTDTFTVTVTHLQTTEVLTTISDNVHIDQTTFENVSESNTWVYEAGTINANQVNFSWDTDECNLFQIYICQYDASGNPYKLSNKNVYASSALTDGAQFNSWTNAGNSYYFTAIAGGNFTISLPTSGVFKVSIRKSSGTGTEVTDNQTFGTWIHNGGLTITAHV